MAERPVIELLDVWLTRDGRTILEQINLRVMEGDVFAILGPNGGARPRFLR